MTFWERVESALNDNNISEAELSRRIGLNQSSINAWKIRGSIPRADIACKTATILNTTVEYLMNGNHSKIINTDYKVKIRVIIDDSYGEYSENKRFKEYRYVLKILKHIN